MKFLKDALGDKSSGILMMVVMFVAAVAIANIGVCMGADLGQLALLTAAFLIPVAGGQIGQALQGLPKAAIIEPSGEPVPQDGTITPPPVAETIQPLGFVQNPLGDIDLGRILKLVAVLIAMELAILIMATRKDAGLIGMAQVCGAFLAYATASEISQKAGGV